MKTIYPTANEAWLVGGKQQDVKKGEPVHHPHDRVADCLVENGKATYEPPKD